VAGVISANRGKEAEGRPQLQPLNEERQATYIGDSSQLPPTKIPLCTLSPHSPRFPFAQARSLAASPSSRAGLTLTLSPVNTFSSLPQQLVQLCFATIFNHSSRLRFHCQAVLLPPCAPAPPRLSLAQYGLFRRLGRWQRPRLSANEGRDHPRRSAQQPRLHTIDCLYGPLHLSASTHGMAIAEQDVELESSVETVSGSSLMTG
jgi:hypothetical protein